MTFKQHLKENAATASFCVAIALTGLGWICALHLISMVHWSAAIAFVLATVVLIVLAVTWLNAKADAKEEKLRAAVSASLKDLSHQFELEPNKDIRNTANMINTATTGGYYGQGHSVTVAKNTDGSGGAA